MIHKSFMAPAAMVAVLFSLAIAETAGAQDLKQGYVVQQVTDSGGGDGLREYPFE